MSITPGPFIPPYAPPPNVPARRAGMLMFALGCVALLIGGACGLFAWLLPTLEQQPEMVKSLDEIRRQTPIDPRLLIGVMAGIFLIYALTAMPLGLLARGGRIAWVVTALVLMILAGLFLAVSAVANIAGGNVGGAFLPVVLTALHGLAAGWFISALRRHAAATPHRPTPAYYAASASSSALPPQPFGLPPPPQPMQDYYLPLPPPPSRSPD